MKIFNMLMIAVIAISILVLTGCEKTDGKVELKESRKELSDMPPGIRWTVNGPVDELGKPIELEEAK
jgi:PBP1b-binding outer membrane lipoprotein LpoB